MSYCNISFSFGLFICLSNFNFVCLSFSLIVNYYAPLDSLSIFRLNIIFLKLKFWNRYNMICVAQRTLAWHKVRLENQEWRLTLYIVAGQAGGSGFRMTGSQEQTESGSYRQDQTFNGSKWNFFEILLNYTDIGRSIVVKY